MPKTGIAYFFYSAEQSGMGFDPKDKDKFKVIYWEGDIATLSRTDFPDDLPEHGRFNPATVIMKPEISMPDYGHEAYKNFTDVETDIFWEEIYNEEKVNKLLGYSDTFQNAMEYECELVTSGFYLGDSIVYRDPNAVDLKENSRNWLLLLQIDSNDCNNMNWGSEGRLYFWIKKEDLIYKKFDKAWFRLQFIN